MGLKSDKGTEMGSVCSAWEGWRAIEELTRVYRASWLGPDDGLGSESSVADLL